MLRGEAPGPDQHARQYAAWQQQGGGYRHWSVREPTPSAEHRAGPPREASCLADVNPDTASAGTAYLAGAADVWQIRDTTILSAEQQQKIDVRELDLSAVGGESQTLIIWTGPFRPHPVVLIAVTTMRVGPVVAQVWVAGPCAGELAQPCDQVEDVLRTMATQLNDAQAGTSGAA